jgi:hypothetical protein
MLHFLGIGAQKAGTSWLYTMLAQHPQISFPAGKEVHFWNRPESLDVAWYHQCFAEGGPKGALPGEITPAYAILSSDRVRRIYDEFPSARLIYLIRNPIERAWSSALMALGRAEMTMDEASDQWFIDHFRSRGSLQRGDYEGCIRTWRAVYPSEQLLIERYESIAAEPRALLGRVAGHLGVDPDAFGRIPEAELTRRVFPGAGHPLRPSLRPALEGLYRDKIRSLCDYLGVELGWR